MTWNGIEAFHPILRLSEFKHICQLTRVHEYAMVERSSMQLRKRSWGGQTLSCI